MMVGVFSLLPLSFARPLRRELAKSLTSLCPLVKTGWGRLVISAERNGNAMGKPSWKFVDCVFSWIDAFSGIAVLF